MISAHRGICHQDIRALSSNLSHYFGYNDATSSVAELKEHNTRGRNGLPYWDHEDLVALLDIHLWKEWKAGYIEGYEAAFKRIMRSKGSQLYWSKRQVLQGNFSHRLLLEIRPT